MGMPVRESQNVTNHNGATLNRIFREHTNVCADFRLKISNSFWRPFAMERSLFAGFVQFKHVPRVNIVFLFRIVFLEKLQQNIAARVISCV